MAKRKARATRKPRPRPAAEFARVDRGAPADVAGYTRALRRSSVKKLLGSRSMTTRQRMFVTAYIAGPPGVRGIANRAAEAAGFALATNPGIGDHLVKKPAVRAAIAAHLARWERSAQDVVDELHRIGFSDMRDYVEWEGAVVKLKPYSQLSDDAAAAIAEVSETTTEHGGTVRFKLHDKVAALTLLAKLYRLVTDRVEHTGRDGGPVEVATYVYLPSNGREAAGTAVRAEPAILALPPAPAEAPRADPAVAAVVELPPHGRNGAPA